MLFSPLWSPSSYSSFALSFTYVSSHNSFYFYSTFFLSFLKRLHTKLLAKAILLLYCSQTTTHKPFRVIDQQLVAVSGLFDELTEHAVLQKETMDTISDLTENAIGHVKQGVGQLQVATKRTVDFRLMVC